MSAQESSENHAASLAESAHARGYLFILLAVLFRASASVCAKHAGLLTAGKALHSILTVPWYYGQLTALTLQAICWILALRRLPLNIAYPFTSLVFALNLLAARYIFKETVHLNQLLGIVVIVIGVCVVARKVPA